MKRNYKAEIIKKAEETHINRSTPSTPESRMERWRQERQRRKEMEAKEAKERVERLKYMQEHPEEAPRPMYDEKGRPVLTDKYCPECENELHRSDPSYAYEDYYCGECEMEVPENEAVEPESDDQGDPYENGYYGLSPAERNPSMGGRSRRY